MIKVNSAMKQNDIIDLLNSIDEEGIQFTFDKKQGLSLVFSTNAEDKERAAKLAKLKIKEQSWGKALNLQVVAV